MPIFMRLVRVAIALAMFKGAASTDRSGAVCSSASHMTSRPAGLGFVHLFKRFGERLGFGLFGAALKFVEHAEFHDPSSPCFVCSVRTVRHIPQEAHCPTTGAGVGLGRNLLS